MPIILVLNDINNWIQMGGCASQISLLINCVAKKACRPDHCSKQPRGSSQWLPCDLDRDRLWGGLGRARSPSSLGHRVYPTPSLHPTRWPGLGLVVESQSLREERCGRARWKAVGRRFVPSKVNQLRGSRVYVKSHCHLLSTYYVPGIPLIKNPSVYMTPGPRAAKSVSGRARIQIHIWGSQACALHQVLISCRVLWSQLKRKR